MKLVAIEIDGAVEVHATAAMGDYTSLCGIDQDDPDIGHRPAALPRRALITCAQCKAIILHCRSYK